MLTSLTIIILLGAASFSLVAWTALLWLGARLAKVKDATLGHVAITALLVCIFQSGLLLLGYLASFAPPLQGTVLLAIAELLAGIVIPILIVSRMLRCTLVRAFLAWLPTLALPVISYIVVLFAVNPFLLQAFSTHANSMAPTILGKHCCGTCPECGQPNYGSPEDRSWNAVSAPLHPRPMICRDFHIKECPPHDSTVLGNDRFIVSKSLTPKRWDLVVFRYPEDPTTNYVKRLVGLPGEEIRIEGGAVWADGKRLTPPAEIAGIHYEVRNLEYGQQVWGSPQNPAKLGPDEYFMLGDFTAIAKDSRYWEQGAPGHHPYAVPESYLIGVVTHIYWPPQRWRAFQ